MNLNTTIEYAGNTYNVKVEEVEGGIDMRKMEEWQREIKKKHNRNLLRLKRPFYIDFFLEIEIASKDENMASPDLLNGHLLSDDEDE